MGLSVDHSGSTMNSLPVGMAGVLVIVPAILTLMTCPYTSSLSGRWPLAPEICAATVGVTRSGMGRLLIDAGALGLARARDGKAGQGVSAASAA